MRQRAASVDGTHTMTRSLHTAQHDQLAEPVAVSTGRFASQIGTTGWPDPALAPVRKATVLRMQARVQYRAYQIDPSVLAEAISERLCAGGLATRLRARAR
jgi:hypothetical protein